MPATPQGDEPCWYCEQEPEGGEANDEQADPSNVDGEDNPENAENNDASKLGTNLGGKPSWSVTCPDTGKSTEVIPGAHHCIPGNASMAKATALHDFMRKGGPHSFVSDIGYDINGAANGVWLPGNYGVRPGKSHYTKKWGSFSADFKNQYAKRAMEAAGGQFHDAHSKYSNHVLKTLEAIADKLAAPGDCPICDKPRSATRPPYGLVARINHVSLAYKERLVGTPDPAAIDQGYYTSSRVKKIYGS